VKRSSFVVCEVAMRDSAPSQKRVKRKHLIQQAFLCVLCAAVGAMYPGLLDWSKTAVEREVRLDERFQGRADLMVEEHRTYPFSTVTVVLMNDLLQLSVGLVVLAKKDGLNVIFKNKVLFLQTIPLGFIYAVGELLTLRAVQKGSGPLYVIISNMKLVVSALVARALFGRSRAMPTARWVQLLVISLLAAMYTLAEAGTVGEQWRWEGALVAVLKCFVSAIISVLCEYSYKGGGFVTVVTLQAFWGFVALFLVIGAALSGAAFRGLAGELVDNRGHVSIFGSGPEYPLCRSDEHEQCTASLAAGAVSLCRCVTNRGWDAYTLGAVVADLSNAVSSALIFKRLSAVVKYICRATSAVPLYLFFCIVGRKTWDFRVFSIIMMLLFQVSVYTLRRHQEAEEQEALPRSRPEGALGKVE